VLKSTIRIREFHISPSFRAAEKEAKISLFRLLFPIQFIFLYARNQKSIRGGPRNETIELSIYANKRTCAFLNKPPVEPPKIGDGVFGSNFGADHAGAASPSARTTND
jgi:hypothetical protein